MAGVLDLWYKWHIQILVLLSFTLQVFLLLFAGARRRGISNVPRILLWLVYLFADLTVIFTLGRMSIYCEQSVQRQLLAFWASFLLVHLGGQDTISAYAMEDNQLWVRHLLTLAVQSGAAAYVIYMYFTGREILLMAATFLIFLVGFVKCLERVWALQSANLDSISKSLDKVEMRELQGPYSARSQLAEEEGLDAEVVLQGAHDLLYICMGQFVDYRVWPTEFQNDAVKLFYQKGSIYCLVEMQLSLMYDIFYTKAAVIHTWCGCWIHVFSLPATVTSFFLFEFSTGKHGHNTVDTTVTYILLVGALLLETVSAFSAMGSTWTCAMLRVRGLDWLHKLLISLRRRLKAAAHHRKWSGTIGQHNLVDFCYNDASLSSSVVSPWRHDSITVSTGTKELVLEEIFRMAQACEGTDRAMRSYRGQCTLKRPDGSLNDLILNIDFDDSILTWHFATHIFLHYSEQAKNAGPCVEAIKTLSNYMMFLFVEHPYMLPGPVRSRLYVNAREELRIRHVQDLFERIRKEDYIRIPSVLLGGATLANKLLSKESKTPELVRVVFGVWVEMLCYAAHRCNRNSHARQLNNGGEFITIAWRLTAIVFDCVYCDKDSFKESARSFFTPRLPGVVEEARTEPSSEEIEEQEEARTEPSSEEIEEQEEIH